MMNIISLPQDCLAYVLRQGFTLQELLCFRRVHPEWKFVVEEYLLKRTKSLKLFASRQQLSSYHKQLEAFNLQHCDYLQLKSDQSNELYIPSGYFNMQLAELLTWLFPEMKQLVVYLSADIPIEELSCLLKRWSDSLTTLSFVGWITSPGSQKCHQFGRVINQLTALKHLDILVHNMSLSTSVAKQSMGDVLLRLESLSGYLASDTDVLSALGPKCTSLRLYQTVSWSAEQMERLVTCNANLRVNLKRIYLMNVLDSDLVPYVCAYFTGLQSIGFKNSPYYRSLDWIDSRLLYHLSSLTHLTELYLPDIQIDENVFLQSHHPLDQLKTVHISGLAAFSSELHQHEMVRTFTELFPAVSSLVVDYCKAKIHIILDGATTQLYEYRVYSADSRQSKQSHPSLPSNCFPSARQC